MSNRKCSFITAREKSLHEKYKVKYPDDKDIHLQIFNNRISMIQSDPNINFNYTEMYNNGQEDEILEIIHNRSKETKAKAAEEAILLPEYSTTNNKATSLNDVVSISEDKANGLVEFVVSEGSLSMEEVESIVSKFTDASNFENALASNLKNNIKSLAELEAFALYLAENRYYNSFENPDNKFTEEQLVANAMRKLNSYAKANSAIAEIRASYREANKPIVNEHKGIVQMSDFNKNGYISTNDLDEITNIKEAYKERTRANAQENSDATIILCPWDTQSAGEKATRGAATGKIAYDSSWNISKNVNSIVNAIVKHLREREDLNIEEGVILNIAGNSIDKIVANNSSQETANRQVYLILKELQNRGIKINQIVTGGQTGVDEAGIIAAAALGIPYRIHAAAIKNKYGQVTYPLRLENDAEGNQQNGFYHANRPDEMNKFLNRFNKESIDKLKGNRQASKAQEGVKSASHGNSLVGRIKTGTPKEGVQLSTKGYSKSDPINNKDTDYVFTDNAQAYVTAQEQDDSWIEDGYNKGDEVQTGVSDVNGTNQAGVRASTSRTFGADNINSNAYGIVVKKYQQKKGVDSFLRKTGQFKDTDADFELFKALNKDMFDRLDSSSNSKKVFPTQMALGKAALPLRFVEWLQDELHSRYGISSQIQPNTKAGYEGYGLQLAPSQFTTNQPTSRQASTDVTKALQQFAQAANNLAAALGGQPIDTSLDVASQEEKSNAQDLMQEQQEKLFEESKVEEKKIKQSITDVEASPLAKLHRAIGKNSPQIVSNRMNMFAMRFSQIVDNIVDEYKDKQWAIYQDENNEHTLEEKERAYYNYTQADNPEGGREFVISKTGNRVLELMKESFQDELESLEDMLDTGEITEDEFNYRKNQWQIVQDHFDTLFSLASVLIERNEGIKIKGSLKKGLTISNSTEVEDAANENNEDNDEGNIATGNDGWVFKTREVDPHTRMSQAVKKLLRNITKKHYTNDGKVTEDTDDLGQETYYQEDQLYAIIVKEFSKVKEPVDFCIKTTKDDGTIEYDFPIFENLSVKYPWISDIIDMLDESLEPDPITGKVSTQTVSLFYSNFRNDFIPYYMSSRGNSTALNLESASQSTLDVATSNFEHGNIFGTHSIYNTSASINMDNVNYWGHKEKVGKKYKPNRIYDIRKFIEKFDDLDSTDEDDVKEIRQGINDIVDLLGSIGLPYSYVEIEGFIETDLGKNLLKKALTEVNVIITGLISNPDNTNLTDTYKKNYRNIGKHLDKVYEEYVQQSFREGDKTRYSYSTPNYIDTLVKFLNQTDLEKRQEYMLNTYGQYQWFYKDGEWQNGVLQRLWDGEDIAFSDIKDMPIINITGKTTDKHEYIDWTPADISSAFFSEFMQNNDSDNEVTRHTAYYNFPIFSDSPICKLVKMMRYTGESGQSYSSSHKSQILPKLLKIAEQELWRINLVRQRRDAGVEEIVNFDTKGSKFCFFPALNKMSLQSLLQIAEGNGVITTFEDKNLRGKLRNDLKQNGVQVDWSTDSEYGYAVSAEQNKSNIQQGILELASKIEKENPTLLELVEQAIEDGNDYLKQEILKMAIADSLISSEKEFIDSNKGGLIQAIDNLISSKKLEDRSAGEELSEDEFLDLYHNELSEYFWNSYLATANIIQMTTTDLAFYKNGVDFQKRYKQVYASGTKLNTQSKYGKQYENTLYLRDNLMTVPTYDYLKKSLQEAVKNKDLHESEMKAILSNYRNITQTDAQAFRSVKSVRDVLDMLGQLTPALEDMFDRMLDKEHPYEYKYSDFNSLIQTIKPFFFGHDTIDSGIASAGLMRLPHQNKNSEFTLLSSVGAIAAIMQNSAQLSALNNWMIANDVDVVQFESAVKVGGQGITDVNWSPSKVSSAIAELNNGEWDKLDSSDYLKKKREKQKPDEEPWEFSSAEDIKDFLDEQLESSKINSNRYNKEINDLLPDYNEVIDILNDRALNEDGSLKPEVVHQHSYDDYMIATATPEHFFDTEAIYGSQFRNLIISDIEDNEDYIVNGKHYKGNEIKEHYRKLVTENLLESFKEVRDKFGDIKKLQEKLKGMIAGNPRYGDDMLDALEIVKDKGGNDVFNIPLHNPSTTNKIQELLDSLWKTTVTKQKIKGGAGILVTDFGFSNTLQVVRNEDGSIKEIECYMPVYSKKFYEKYLKDDGTLDFARMERECPDLLRVVGTRIPTEGKYSMLNLKIKGFLPQINGGAVMLPAEITQTAGSDFDKLSMLK